MRFRVCGLWVLLAAGCSGAFAQTDPRGLQQAIKGKHLFLRSFSAEAVDRYTWLDGKLAAAPARVHTLAVFTPESVSQKGSRLEIKGTRSSVYCEPKSTQCGVTGRNDVRLLIDLSNADPNAALDVQDQLFFASEADAVVAIPGSVAGYFKALLPNSPWDVNTTAPSSGKTVTSPRVLKVADPQYTQDARDAKVNGSVRIGFVVDTNGKPQDLWLLKSLRYGLDESAEAAVRRYQFAPAMRDERPVAVGLSMDVDFRMF